MIVDGERCKWFSWCTNYAVTTLPHPILGEVPVCDRCLHSTMSKTEFGDYAGLYNMPTILYRLCSDNNAGSPTNLFVSENELATPDTVDLIWGVDMGQLLCIEGMWQDFGYGSGDPTLPEWKELGIDRNNVDLDDDVNYFDDFMVIVGNTGMCACFWIFKRAKAVSALEDA